MTVDPVEHELRSMGAKFGPEVLQRTRGLYRLLVKQAHWAARPRRNDLVYGSAERNRLDIFPADVANAPVLLFVHGGGFVGGDKAVDEEFYANVGCYFAAHGFLAVTMNYRLAGTDPWPAGSEDVSAALDWIAEHVTEHGGDPDRIVLLGQSAGAAHVAGCLFHPNNTRAGGRAVRGVILMSGFYEARPPLAGGVKTYFGDDAAAYAVRSPATHVSQGHPPLLLSVAELDPPEVAAQTLQLAVALNEADRQPPRLLWFEGHNHVSTIHGLGVGADVVGQALVDFATRVVAPAS